MPDTRPQPSTRRSLIALLLLSGFALSQVAAGCGSQQTCDDLRADYKATLERQSRSPESGATSGMSHNLLATQIHEEALGEMIEGVLERKGTLSHRVNRKLPNRTHLDMTVTWTRLSFDLTPECDDCVLLTSGLSANIDARVFGVPVPVKTAGGQLRGLLPLKLTATREGSALSTDISKMTLKEVDLRVPGLPSELTALVLPMARSAAQAVLKEVGGPITLARWRPMELPGRDKLKIVARELVTLADRGVVWIGWGADLPIAPDAATLQAAATLRDGERAAVSFSGAALTPLMQAMQGQGGIPSRLNSDLKPDPKGDVYITLSQVTPTAGGLATRFSAWNLPESGTCYRVDMEAATHVTVTPPNPAARQIGDRQGAVQVAMEDMRVVNTQGDDTLVKVGLWLRSLFVEETLQAQTKLLAAHDFDLGGAGKVGVDLQRAEFSEAGATIVFKPRVGPQPRSITTPKLKPKLRPGVTPQLKPVRHIKK